VARGPIEDSYQGAVNYMLDIIIFLQKRIDLLDKALPILLEKHQLKGLYLTPAKNRDEVYETYKKHNPWGSE